jgi:hypothetical protein
MSVAGGWACVTHLGERSAGGLAAGDLVRKDTGDKIAGATTSAMAT